ncbi:hypothetical protein [Sphingomonas arenae]|uniref:hypothetical protein n=1 Tax=Sphingomonas arenae TaxID=2812555 RepID=UPI001966E8B8|nr:hypothetical protein [Sphingomonas arenae]
MAVKDYVILQGKQVSYEIARIPVDAVTLDPKNPRIEYLLGQKFGSGATQEEIVDELWAKDQVKALGQSILSNGGVREHIIVQRKKDGGYLVREGNCRSASSKKLKESNPGDNRFDTIPAHVFDEQLSEEDVAVLIAEVHVAKKISWDAYTQAKQIHELHRIHGKPYDWLTNNLRMGKSKISEYLAAYDAMTSFLAVHSDPKNISRFSLFHEMVRKKGLKALWDNDTDGFRARFFQWVIDGKIHDPRHVRDLEQILKDPDASAAMDKSGHDAAAQVLIGKDPTLGSDTFYSIKKATEAVKNTPMSDVQDLKAGDVQKILLLKNLHRAIDDLATMAGVKL